MNVEELHLLWDEFLEAWPIAKVKQMTLDEYSQAGSSDTFMNWVEFRTKPLATISGVSSFPFGIYSRKDKSQKENTKQYIYADQFAWQAKYGDTEETAFSSVKTEILKVLEAVELDQLHKIDDINLASMVKWKIAFLYQDPNNIKIIPIFSEDRLRHLTNVDIKDRNFSMQKAYSQLIREMKDEDLFSYTFALTQKYLEAHPKEKKDTQMINDNADSSNMTNQALQSLNRILYGATGTGKTYNTINHALSIIQGVDIADLDSDRQVLKKEFDQLKDQGRIKFVTFHQSFSYEDFVEGIRAETDKQGNLKYQVKPGVFKEICEYAISNNMSTLVGKIFGRNYQLISVNQDISIIQKPNGNLLHLSTQLAQLLYKAVIDGEITIEDISQKRAIDKLKQDPLLEPYIVNGYCTVWANLIQLMQDNFHIESEIQKPYILIIDEINRGNISRIFGELITLIEDSKRKGATEALSVTLPYSKEEFFVPQNLYIIGTMNSSDRSLTGLDIALRRRFTFIEMPPKPELLNHITIEGLQVEKLLTVMNQRIEVLLDRDHCIGHANFMSLKSDSKLDELAQIFKQKIIPQLQEYFFDDWAKINLVLFNNGMIIENNDIKVSNLFPKTNDFDHEYFEQKKVWKLNEDAFKNIANFKEILGPQDKVNTSA